MKKKHLSRRNFIQLSALSVGALGIGPSAMGRSGTTVCLLRDPGDPIVSSEPVRRAVEHLSRALSQRGITLREAANVELPISADFCILVASSNLPLAIDILNQARLSALNSSESLALVPTKLTGHPALLACGSDARGLSYAVHELADRVEFADDPLRALKSVCSISEKPFTEVRSIGRSFVSDIEDKSWFHDREMWPAYFSMLATNRFNRFTLNFGIGYDFLQDVTDSYLLFAYPFLLSVPGYNVRAVNLPDAERDQNLASLQFISAEAAAHGLDFQLGLWTHGYQWKDSPHPNYTIEGLTAENHAAYCRDALTALLQACPAIGGVTLRTHGESGVPEGSYGFWKTVFGGIPLSGRKVEIDLHTKGLDQTMIDNASATGMPIRLSPKYWAEHMGMPYQQTAIRELELPKESASPQSFFALSSGTRSFTRYGYADFLREDRPYSLIYRIWPGTHRFLLWGDPLTTAAHARAFRFCGSNGVELYEPLTFKGRRGSGVEGGRCAYADSSLNPHWDWQKYLCTYRVWGRLLYNAETDAEVWRRPLRKQFRAGAMAVESALATATRILPLVTTAHLPSAANDTYDPEFYTNQSMVVPSGYPYGDTPAPKIFSNVSPLDPQMFSRMSDFAAELLSGNRSGKYSPVEVAQWLEDLADASAKSLHLAERQVSAPDRAEFRRIKIDVAIQIGLGRFFAAKLRSGTLYAIYEQTGEGTALKESLSAYRRARNTWAELANNAKSYSRDISYGPHSYQRGHWRDRLPAIDTDLAEMSKRLENLASAVPQTEQIRAAVAEVVSRPHRSSIECDHTPPAYFVPGQDSELTISPRGNSPKISIGLFYRHVNQAERYQEVEMENLSGTFHGVIPDSYTDSKFPMQYYFELKQSGNAWLYPGFNADLSNQPYFVLRSKTV